MPDTITFKFGNIATASRARSANVATIVTGAAHKLVSGRLVDVSGLGGTGYNATGVTVTVVNTTTFTYPNTGGDETTTADTGGTVVNTRDFSPLHVQGFDKPDRVRLINHIQQRSDSGKPDRYSDGYQRVITVNFNTLSDADQVWLWDFFFDINTQKLSYGSESNLEVMIESPDEEFVLEWADNVETAKFTQFVLLEKNPRTTKPSSW